MINNTTSLAFFAVVAVLMAVAVNGRDLIKGSVDVGQVHGEGDLGSNPSGTLDANPVFLSGSTNPIEGSADVGPIHASGTTEHPIRGCVWAPGVHGCLELGPPIEGFLHTDAVDVSGKLNPELPVNSATVP